MGTRSRRRRPTGAPSGSRSTGFGREARRRSDGRQRGRPRHDEGQAIPRAAGPDWGGERREVCEKTSPHGLRPERHRVGSNGRHRGHGCGLPCAKLRPPPGPTPGSRRHHADDAWQGHQHAPRRRWRDGERESSRNRFRWRGATCRSSRTMPGRCLGPQLEPACSPGTTRLPHALNGRGGRRPSAAPQSPRDPAGDQDWPGCRGRCRLCPSRRTTVPRRAAVAPRRTERAAICRERTSRSPERPEADRRAAPAVQLPYSYKPARTGSGRTKR